MFPGVTAALDRFEEAGLSFAVCTNKIEYPSILLLTALGVAGRFKAICGKDTFPVSKPDGEALSRTIAGPAATASRHHGRRFRKDIDTARNAKIPVMAVNFGYTSEPVETFKPDRVIGHYDELWGAVAALGVA